MCQWHPSRLSNVLMVLVVIAWKVHVVRKSASVRDGVTSRTSHC